LNALITPLIVPRAQHSISRAQISSNALKVLYTLHRNGYQAYLVGGGIRDLLLGLTPKDFDIATNATPEQIQSIFRNCRLIGRRFRLAHICFSREIIEVATFRAAQARNVQDRQFENGMLICDNSYGTLAEDVVRRDFTINALYYNIQDFSLVDYTGGLEDLKQRRLRLIGYDPWVRYREDPVRMLRVVRFASKLNFDIDQPCEQPLTALAPLLRDIPDARLFDEVLKLFHSGAAQTAFHQLLCYQLFAELFPETNTYLTPADQSNQAFAFIEHGLSNTDRRIHEQLPVTPFFLFAVLLWEPVRRRYQALCAKGHSSTEAMMKAARHSCLEQQGFITIPKRYNQLMREIWYLQPRLERYRHKTALQLLSHPRFRAAYDFLLLRTQVGEIDEKSAHWWTSVQEGKPVPKSRRRKRYRKKRSQSVSQQAPNETQNHD
jgi:poly(A) polymerase